MKPFIFTSESVAKWHPDKVSGIDPGLSVGDIVIGTELLQHDFDVTAFGHAKGYLCTGNDHNSPTVFYADEGLTDALESTAISQFPEKRTGRGRIATGDLFVSDSGKKQELWETCRKCKRPYR